MTKKLLVLIPLFFISLSTFAQTDSLRNEILNYQESKAGMIDKGRRLLLEKFLAGDQEKVREVLQYLVTYEEDADYVAFYPLEKWLLYYWTEQYPLVLQDMLMADSILVSVSRTRIRPRQDVLAEKLLSYLMGKQAEAKLKIQLSDLTDAEKNVLILNLDYLLSDTEQTPDVQEDLNRQAEQYLAAFPDSKYNPYVKSYIRFAFKPSTWGFAFEFFSGYGSFTENLETNFNNSIPMGIAFDIFYNRWGLYLRNYIGFSKTKNALPFPDAIWSDGAQARVFLPEASLGYAVLDNRYVKLAPFAGISSMHISPTAHDIEQIPEYKDVGLSFTTTYTAGLSLDLKLGKTTAVMRHANGEESYWFARIRYSYNQPQFNWKYTGYNGNFHSITIGIGGFGRVLKRDY
ncbi:hypothetical protein [Pontibacter sp. SGAir0037]|uniref:hypothetical protein n=1 Tax=Pontibacter sp. SGAir0037 TaxID=2571030 RepID=UPI0010CD25FF|nr:hypothetical protein [Pontibacter sp. SGAir0037]QCR21429.1 hypothetical protein C1N53_03060 [Pontibacter sp. SGAir0037]